MLVLLCICLSVSGQVTKTDYDRATQFLSENITKKYYRSWVNPQWDDESTLFWYSVTTPAGKEYVKVNTKTGKKVPLFNVEKLAAALTQKLEREVKAAELPLSNIKLLDQGKSIAFKTDTLWLKCELKSYALSAYETDKSYGSLSVLSPDKQKLAVVHDYNVWIKNLSAGDSVQVTQDGNLAYGNGVSPSWYSTKDIETAADHDLDADITWSPDSRHLIVGKYDRRKAENLYLYKILPESGQRAQVYGYERPLAGDSLVPTIEYVMLDADQQASRPVDLSPNATFLNYGFSWMKNSAKAWQVRFERGYKACEVVEVDGVTGKSRVVLRETADTYVDPLNHDLKVLEGSDEFIWLSERDGWNHIYLHDWKSGAVKNQITKGDFVVRSIVHLDEKNRKVYFTAGGKETGRDPYYPHLYVVNLDGSGMQLLSPEDAHHTFFLSPDKNYVVDNYSTVQKPNIAVLRRLKDGKVMSKLEEGDISELKEMGWQTPEPFVVKGRDGKTDIYGVLFKPANFDPTKKYPVIDGTYSGPQTIRAPKTFYRGLSNDDTPLAQLGFVMVNIDGLGSAFRSKAFHDVSYKNLGDIGGPDHMIAIKTLAEKYSWMDSTRVGIFGHSAGGYDAAHALLVYSDFYKVGVATAGNHDHRAAKAWWPELYMGYPAGKHYDEQSNYNLASNLKGHLLLVHGDQDQNVNPTASMRLAAELIKANKDFELLLIPNKDHGQVYYDKYMIRKRWDFFVKYLQETNPPREYKIK